MTDRSSGRMHRGERGSITLVVAAVLVVATSLLVALGRGAATGVDAARARATADMTVLAGAVAGVDAARAVAEANGAELDEFGRESGITVVSVQRSAVTATAAATTEVVG